MYIQTENKAIINTEQVAVIKTYKKTPHECWLTALLSNGERIDIESCFDETCADITLDEIMAAIKEGANTFDIATLSAGTSENTTRVCQKYEQLKRKLSDLDLTAGQYEEIIKAVAEVLEL
ncbi:MAG: hypothetical protein ACI4J2_04050 [Ruminococcus sp.]